MKFRILLGLATLLLVLGFIFYMKTSSKEPEKKAEVTSIFWSVQRKGTNFFNRIEQRERFQAAKKLGLSWVRLTPSKWESANPNLKTGDFLLGPRDNYTGLVPEDLEHLRTVLNWAQEADLRVVLTFLNLPGSYWKQHNGGVQDRRLWSDRSLWSAAARFMKDLASALKDHPALAAIDVLNEPSPEFVNVRFNDWLNEDYKTWFEKIKGTAQDLNEFNLSIHKAIREVDLTIPIIFESGFYATPWALKIVRPIDDPNVLYSFHMYEPFVYTFNHRNKETPYRYPGEIPFGEIKEQRKSVVWEQKQIDSFFEPILDWQRTNKVPANKVVVGEFGVNRYQPGAGQYFADLIAKFDKEGWHWAFYSFREDEWDIMDYELGDKKPGEEYWEAIEHKRIPKYDNRNSLFIEAINHSLKR